MKILLGSFIIIATLGSISQSIAETRNKIQTAVNIVENLCLSGSEYGLAADAEGNISIKNFKPNAIGSFTVNIRSQGGATALKEHLRLIGDREIRECTQKHIPRILDALFEATPPSKADLNRPNNSIKTAAYLGYVPGELTVVEFVEGPENLYFRFTVKESAELTVDFSEYNQPLIATIVTDNEKVVINPKKIDKRKSLAPQFFAPGDYFVKVSCYKKDQASSFKFTIRSS